MIGRIAAAVGGFLATQPLLVALYRLGLDPRGVLVAVVVICAIGALKGGLLRWAALGIVIGYVGFHAFVAWVLNEIGDGQGWRDL